MVEVWTKSGAQEGELSGLDPKLGEDSISKLNKTILKHVKSL